MIYRLAVESDFAQLAELRWEFRTELHPASPGITRKVFLPVCLTFLQRAYTGGNWAFWVAEEDGRIIANAYVQRILKVPNPNRLDPEFGYITNVFTRPEYRNHGIGARLIRQVQQWGREQRLEMFVLWPSRRSGPFYQRAGFHPGGEALECSLDEEP